MRRRELVIVHDGEVAKTDKARCFLFDGKHVWIPESVISWDDGEINELLLPDWFVYRKGLEVYLK